MENIFEIPAGTTKIDRYKEVLKQINSLLDKQKYLISNLANVSAVLKLYFPEFSWVGFYLIRRYTLMLGPFQGKPACTKIKIGMGVCGTAVKFRKTIIVPDVSKFPGHIYCDPNSRSEIVVPLVKLGKIIGVLDIDSYELNTFDEIDRFYLENINKIIIKNKI